MSAMTTRLLSLLAIGALFVLTTAPIGMAQESSTLDLEAAPPTVSVWGEVVLYELVIQIPDADLPATITAMTSDLHGDLTDAANPVVINTNCEAGVPYSVTPGNTGMYCSYQALVDGDPGEVTNTVTVDVQLADGSDVTLTDSFAVTISDDLGAIRGTLIDSDTGLPIPDTYVWGDMEGFTDSSGVFFFDGLEPGAYRFYSGNAAHGTSGVPVDYRSDYAYEWYDEEPVGLSGGYFTAIPVTVLPGEITEIEWELTRGGVITGRVTSSDTGEPITDYNVTFWLTRTDGSTAPQIFGNWDGVEFADDGTYRSYGLRAGDYVACFETIYGWECWDDLPFSFPASTGVLPTGDLVSVVLRQTTSGVDAQFATEGETGNGNGGDGGNGEGEPAELPFTGSTEPWLALTAMALVVGGAGALVISHRPKTR